MQQKDSKFKFVFFTVSVSRQIIFYGLFLFFVYAFFHLSVVQASETNGRIDSVSKYAWGENIGWLNFGCDNCNVNITDSGISGYAWSRQYGWINLSANQVNNTGVQNTNSGVLSGYAWSSNLGWIDFTGVTINTDGEFKGHATIRSNGSKINFNCDGIVNSCTTADFKVKTDWRPTSVRHVVSSAIRSGSSGYAKKDIPIVVELVPQNPVIKIVDKVSKKITKVIDNSKALWYLLNPKSKNTEVAVVVPKLAPLSLKTKWNLLPSKTINSFVFAPLPYEVRMLASKFPEIDRTLKSVGISRLSDLDKLTGVNLNIPGLAVLLDKTVQNVGVKELKNINPINSVGINTPGISSGSSNLASNLNTPGISNKDSINSVNLSLPGLSNMDKNIATNIGVGKIALLKGIPVNNFSLQAKRDLPSEFVFARANSELVDLNVAMSVGEKGKVTQRISSLPGQVLKLVVKPISRARSVEGYFVFKSATPSVARNMIPRESLSASALFSMGGVVSDVPEPPIEKKLVLSAFEYVDPDHDGIYTADVMSPAVPGEYEVVTVIDYIDPELGVRKMSLVTVIDPEGYIFEKNDGKETRIPKAVISLYSLNSATDKYELWNAGEYQQKNPQTTDIRGTYSFLVPEGSYYFQIHAPGYKDYKGEVFGVVEGSGVHENIELKSSQSWFNQMDYKTVLLIVVLLLLMYNLFRNSFRNKA